MSRTTRFDPTGRPVAGAASGVGLESARECHAAGARVVVLDRDEAALSAS